jgi:hypothetical protein
MVGSALTKGPELGWNNHSSCNGSSRVAECIADTLGRSILLDIKHGYRAVGCVFLE